MQLTHSSRCREPRLHLPPRRQRAAGPCSPLSSAPRLCRLLIALVVSALVAVAAGSAVAQEDYDKIIRDSEETISDSEQRISEKESELEALRELAKSATENLKAAEATADELVEAINTVTPLYEAQQEALDNAARAVAEAEATQRDAAARVAALQEELEATEQALKEALIQSFVSFQAPEGSLSVFSDDPWDNARQEALAGFATGSRIDDIDELRRLGAELERWRMIAEEATATARDRQEQEARLLEQLEAALQRETELFRQADERVELWLHEAEHFREHDAALAAEIERNARLVADALSRLQGARKAQEEERRRAEAAEAESSRSPASGNSGLGLVWVRGIQVNVQIADQTEGLLAAMEAEGFKLAGWGYRTHQAQISLRRAHCGTSNYAVWEMPSSRCRPPTARPGRSNHEQGLAIDFTYNGRIVSSRNSAVFKALQRLAPQFGLHNLPSEPWHWSVDGR